MYMKKILSIVLFLMAFMTLNAAQSEVTVKITSVTDEDNVLRINYRYPKGNYGYTIVKRIKIAQIKDDCIAYNCTGTNEALSENGINDYPCLLGEFSNGDKVIIFYFEENHLSLTFEKTGKFGLMQSDLNTEE